MRFKLKKLEKNKHTDIVTAVAFNASNDLVSVSEDLSVYKWDLNGEPLSKLMDLDVPCVDIDWFPSSRATGEFLAMACANGSIKLMSKSGRIERSVDKAHTGSITSIKWTFDGAALATSGEDGCIKIWSKNLELRSTLTQAGKPIYCVTWSPDNNNVLYCSGQNLTILPTVPGTKQNSWKAHDNLVLVADWNVANNLIVSGGEDCKYRIWDSYGRMLYCSTPNDNVITSVAWNPSGEAFAVGSYNLLRLCDQAGWTHSFSKPNTGSLMKLSWNGTMVAGAGGNGSVIVGYLVEKKLHWGYIEAVLEDENRVRVNDVLHEVGDELDLRDRVVNMSLGYNYLVVVTTTQCYVYNVMNWDAPIIFDVKETVTLIVQGAKYFCLVDRTNGITIYNYSGTLMSSPKYSGCRIEFMNKRIISLSTDVNEWG